MTKSGITFAPIFVYVTGSFNSKIEIKTINIEGNSLCHNKK